MSTTRNNHSKQVVKCPFKVGYTTPLMWLAIVAAALFITSVPAVAQVPTGFNYQALATDETGEPLRDYSLSVRFSILHDTIGSPAVYVELHEKVATNSAGLFSVVIGTGDQVGGGSKGFMDIDWGLGSAYLMTEINVGGSWLNMGTSRLWSVPYAIAAGGISGAVTNFEIAGTTTSPEEALFLVRNRSGDPVFAVYNGGVRVFVGDGDSKNSKGGFAVGSFDRNKGEIQDLLIVNRDSVRVYLDENDSKISKGGFAVGSFDRNKGLSNEFLRVTRDSVRIYLDESDRKISKGGFAVGSFDRNKGLNQNLFNVSRDSVRIYIDEEQSKISKGGFAVGSFDRNKSSGSNFFDISPAATRVVDPSEPRILWYPLKNAFLAGQVLIESPEDVGENSIAMGYETKASGNYSQAMGYRSQATGHYSSAFGNEAIAERTNSFAFGQYAQARANESYAFGRGATALGYRSFAFGSAGIDSLEQETGNTRAQGMYSLAFGMGSVSEGIGSVALGLADTARGHYSVAIGYNSSALGYSSVALGNHLVSSGGSEVVVGRYNKLPDPDSDPWGTTGRIFTVGAGLRDNIRINAMTVLSNRDTWFNGNVHLYGSTRHLRFRDSHGVLEVSEPEHHLYFRIGGTATPQNRMIIRGDNGNVGIGTTSPEQRLHVIGTMRSTNSAYLATSTGNVGIGTTDPQEKLSVVGNISSNGMVVNGDMNIEGTGARYLYFNSNSAVINVTPANHHLYFRVGGTATQQNRMIVRGDNGHVGIGTNDPSERLTVHNGSTTGTYTTSGWMHSSDANLKANVSKLNGVLDKILNVSGVRFTFKEDPEEREQIGFIAQELQKEFPELVLTGNSGMKSVSYGQVTPILLEAIKEQQQIIESQAAELDRQNSRIDNLEQQLSQLLQMLNQNQNNNQ